MELFFGKKKEEKASACSCSGAQAKAADPGTGSVVVLGTGCASCHALLENTREAAAKVGLDNEVEYVTDLAQIAAYGVMRMPALVVNGTVVSSGKILKPEEIEALLNEARK